MVVGGSTAVAASAKRIPWPEYIVDANRLFGAIAAELGGGADGSGSHKIYDRAYTIEQYIEKARQKGKIKRYIYQDPRTGEVLAYGYHRDDIKRLIDQSSKLI